MNSLLLIWSQFLFCVLLIGVAGLRLSRYGDAIAAHTGLSRSWIGLVLVATVTSLPELVTGISAVTVAATPDIAAGDALGSCVFNLAILAMVDLLWRRQALYAVVSRGHALSAAFGALLLVVAALALLFGGLRTMPSLGHVSLASVLIIMLYLVAMRALYLAERRHSAQRAEEDGAARIGLKPALMGYGLASAVVVGAGIWLPLVGVELAEAMGWSHSFVGTLFIAAATSVPELATTWGAVRVGALDMAVGNLLGSNMFDVLILALDDLAFVQGPLYRHVTPLHAVTALSAATMSGIVTVALLQRPQTRVWRTASWASLLTLGLYLLNALIQREL